MRRVSLLVLFGSLIATLPMLCTAKPVERSRKVKIKGKTYVRWDGRHANGTRWYTHFYRNDRKVLTHKDWNEKGHQTHQFTYRNDYLHGPFKRWHGTTGALAARGTYAYAALKGLHETFHANGSRKTAENWKNRVREGRYQSWYADGKPQYEGAFAKGQAIGTWRIVGPDGTERAETFVDGIRQTRPVPASLTGSFATPDFAMVFARGSFLSGFDSHLTVAADGRARLGTVRRSARVNGQPGTKRLNDLARGELWYDMQTLQADLVLSAADQQAIRAHVEALDPWRHPARIQDRNVHDGTQWVLVVRSGGKTHRIDLDNRFPDAFKTFAERIDTLLSGYAFERLTARTVKGSGNRTFALPD